MTEPEGAFDICIGTELPLVPEGVYVATFATWETRKLFGGRAPKLIVWWLVDDRLPFGVTLPRYYNVLKLVGPPRAKGRFNIGRNSQFLRDYARLVPLDRWDRPAVSRLEGLQVLAHVRSVTTDATGQPIPDALQYSVIDRIEPLPGHEVAA